MSTEGKERIVEKIIELDVPVDKVWEALTDADEIVKWFSTHAKVTPGVGGSIALGWSENYIGDNKIIIWEENKHLQCERVIESIEVDGQKVSEVNDDELAPPDKPLTWDYFLEDKGGSTVLRIVTSGFGDGPEWDDEYDAIYRGWGLFVLNLKHFLQFHPLEESRHAWLQIPFTIPVNDAWNRLMGSKGMCAKGEINCGQPDGPYAVMTANGEMMEGRVNLCHPREDLALSIENMNDSLFRISLMDWYGNRHAGVTILAYGMTKKAFNDYCDSWTKFLTELFE